MDFLTVTTPTGKSFRREIGAEGLRIGRSSQNELVLEDPGVSRVHARIVRFPEGLFVMDAGGKNGTFVNDQRVSKPTLLRAGDVLRLGTTILTMNGPTSSPVEIVDIPAGPATTVLKVDDFSSTPSLGLRSGSDRDTNSPLTPYPARPAGSSGPISGTFAGAAPLNIIFEADQELVFHRPLGEILEKIVDLVGKAVPFDRAILMLLEGSDLVPRVLRVPLEEEGRTISISRSIADRVIRQHESVLTEDALGDPRFKEGQSVVALHIRAAMCVPLWNNREVIGLVYIDSRRRAGLYNEEHLRLLAHLANVAAIKIENARLFEQVVEAQRIERELEKAWEIQNQLLPAQSPPIDRYLLHGSSVPCEAVGGDVYDYLELSKGRYGIALGDVAGKGLAAALLMSAFQASLRAFSELDLSPQDTIVRLNRLLCRRLPSNRFVTLFYAVLDPSSNLLTYVNAGHNPPWLVSTGGEAVRLTGTGRPLGLFETGAYEARSLEMSSGQVLVCYSDGVTEATNAEGEEFGEKRLVDIVRGSADSVPADIVGRITGEIGAFHAGGPRQDDITMVILKREN